MALTTLDIPPLDPNGFTGPIRMMGGVARIKPVTPGTAYGEFARWLYVGVQGDVSIVCWDGTTQVLDQLVAGVWHPIYSIKVNSSGTTATNIMYGS